VLPEYEQQYLQLPHGVMGGHRALSLSYRYGGVYFDTDYKFFKPFPARLLAKRCELGDEEELNSALGRPSSATRSCVRKRLPEWLEIRAQRLRANGADESDVVFRSGPTR